MTAKTNPELEAELEQMAEGVALERQREYLGRVRPALYAMQRQLQVIHDADSMAKAARVKTPDWIDKLVESEGAFAKKVLAVEDAAEEGEAFRKQTEREEKMIKDIICGIESKITPRILQASKVLARATGRELFSASWLEPELKCGVGIKTEGDKQKIVVKYGFETLSWRKKGYIDTLDRFDEMDLVIQPQKDSISMRFNVYHSKSEEPVRAKEVLSSLYVFGDWRKDSYLGLWRRSPDYAFKKVANDIHYREELSKMYAMVPDAILTAVRPFQEKAKIRHGWSEDEARRLMRIAGEQ